MSAGPPTREEIKNRLAVRISDKIVPILSSDPYGKYKSSQLVYIVLYALFVGTMDAILVSFVTNR